MDSGDVAGMKSARADLDNTLQEFSTRLYQQAGSERAGYESAETGASSNGSSQDEDTVDAEFTDQGAKS